VSLAGQRQALVPVWQRRADQAIACSVVNAVRCRDRAGINVDAALSARMAGQRSRFEGQAYGSGNHGRGNRWAFGGDDPNARQRRCPKAQQSRAIFENRLDDAILRPQGIDKFFDCEVLSAARQEAATARPPQLGASAPVAGKRLHEQRLRPGPHDILACRHAMIEHSERLHTGKAMPSANLFEHGLVLNFGSDRAELHVAALKAAKVERHQEIGKIAVSVAENSGVLNVLEGGHIACERSDVQLSEVPEKTSAALLCLPPGYARRIDQGHDGPAGRHHDAQRQPSPDRPCFPHLMRGRYAKPLHGAARSCKQERKAPSPNGQRHRQFSR
jgi:hypothetical protein